MKVLIIYSTLYGNTKRLAETIATALSESKPQLMFVEEAQLKDLLGVDLLFFGTPTHGGRPQPSAQAWLDKISANSLVGTMVATFDTRLAAQDQTFLLRLLMKIIGYAAPKAAKILESKGGQTLGSPAGFIVTGKEGSFQAREEERAVSWAQDIFRQAKLLYQSKKGLGLN